MLNAIIIEDEQNAADLLEAMLHNIAPTVNVHEKCRDLPSAVKSIKRTSPDIVFLDIELPVYSGIQLLDFLNPEEISFHLIFTTAYNEFAVRAFEMSATAYLMKPIQEEKLHFIMNKILKNYPLTTTETLPVLQQNLLSKSSKKIVVPVTNGFEIIDTENILYLKADGSYTHIYLTNGTNMLVSKNLRHFESILSGSPNFLRIHRSYIANIKFARKILRRDGGILILEDKTELPVVEEKISRLLFIIPNM